MASRKQPPPGSVWRVKYDTPDGSKSVNLRSADYPANLFGRDEGVPTVGRMILDEVVIGSGETCWLHVEQMAVRQWFVELCGRKVMVTIGEDGKPKMGEWYE